MSLESRRPAARRLRAANRRLQPTLALAAALALAGAGPARAQDAPAGVAPALHAKFDSLQDKLSHNAYGRPLVLQSTQSSDRLEG